MAIIKHGIFGPVRGKLGNLVYYESNGQDIVRRIGANLHPPSMAQLACRAGIAVMSNFLKKVLEFVNAGFGLEAKAKKSNAYNLAMSCNKKNALKGAYPDIELDYPKVMLSEGSLLPAVSPSAVLSAEGLWFNWATYTDMPWPERTDQVMLMAYFPVLGKAVFLLYGPARIAGTALLEISAPMLGAYMETYISFISADRSQVSNSIYTGSFNQ
jgi:hypothetical protein